MNNKKGFFLAEAMITVLIAIIMVKMAFSLIILQEKEQKLEENSFYRYQEENQDILKNFVEKRRENVP